MGVRMEVKQFMGLLRAVFPNVEHILVKLNKSSQILKNNATFDHSLKVNLICRGALEVPGSVVGHHWLRAIKIVRMSC
jgi:hypothetical protein